MNLSLQNLRYFVTVAEMGSVTAAARRLYISQPSVSEAIKHLELMLGQQLFIRIPARGMVLTPVGERALAQAYALLVQADDFQATVDAPEGKAAGTLRAACFVNLAPVYFADLLARFHSRHPWIKVRFQDGHQEDVLDGVRSGLFELAVTFDLGKLDDFEVTVLAEIPPRAILSIDHPLAKKSEVSLKKLAPEPLILMDLPHSRDYFISLFGELCTRPNLQHLTTSFEMVRTLAGNGLGYGLLNLIPKSPITYDGKEIRAIPISEPLQPLRIVVIRLVQMPLREVSIAFVDFAREYFAGQSFPTSHVNLEYPKNG